MQRNERRRKARETMRKLIHEGKYSADKTNLSRQERRNKAWSEAIEKARNEDKEYKEGK